MLVSVLTTSSRTREPLDSEVGLIALCIRGSQILRATRHHRDRYRRRVDAAAFLRGRNSLDPVAAGLVFETAAAFASNLEAYGVEPDGSRGNVRAVALSTFRLCKAFVGFRQLSYEELRVVSAFGGTDFQCDDGRHPDVPFLVDPGSVCTASFAARPERRQRCWSMGSFRVVMAVTMPHRRSGCNSCHGLRPAREFLPREGVVPAPKADGARRDRRLPRPRSARLRNVSAACRGAVRPILQRTWRRRRGARHGRTPSLPFSTVVIGRQTAAGVLEVPCAGRLY